MTIQVIQGDLLDAFDKGEVDVIGHVVNCQGVMGSGIAKSIRERYPRVHRAYKELHNETDRSYDLLGHCQGVYLSTTRAVYNLHAQYQYGSPTRDLDYGALGKCLYEMANELDLETTVGFPYKMGSDRAKGDWDIVFEMIEFYFQGHDIKFYQLEK